MRIPRLAAVALAVTAAAGGAAGSHAHSQDERLLFIGTYTRAASKGIYAFRFNDRTGALTPVGLAAASTDPSFLAASPDRRFVFAVNETSSYGGERSGSATSFAVDALRGTLTPINEASTRGADPCHLAVDHTGRFLAIANYSGGNTVVLPIGPDGRLSAASHRSRSSASARTGC